MSKNPKHQIIIIGGGTVFKNKQDLYKYLKNKPLDPYQEKPSWKKWLAEKLNKDFEIFIPTMPNFRFADYKAWQIWFEKYLEFINPDPKIRLVLVGHSSGSVFLLKYLSENKLPKQITQLHLISTPIKDFANPDNEIIGNFQPNLNKLASINTQAKDVYIYHSQDDPAVPFSHSQILSQKLKPNNFEIFKDRGHFNQATFPEILTNIQRLL